MPNQKSKILVCILSALSIVGAGYFLAGSSLFSKGEIEKPIFAPSLTQDQRVAIAQANSIGDRVLSECTPVLPSGSHDCNIFVKQLADNCNTELRNYFKYCSDARLQGYLSDVGGYDG